MQNACARLCPSAAYTPRLIRIRTPRPAHQQMTQPHGGGGSTSSLMSQTQAQTLICTPPVYKLTHVQADSPLANDIFFLLKSWGLTLPFLLSPHGNPGGERSV